MSRHIGRSPAGLPRWVQLWLLIQVGLNSSSLALAVIDTVNLPMVVLQAGLTRLLSFPHPVWLPLLAFLLDQLTAERR